MVSRPKPAKQVLLMLGLIVTAQCCCCIIPIRWRGRMPRIPASRDALVQTVQVAWEEVVRTIPVAFRLQP